MAGMACGADTMLGAQTWDINQTDPRTTMTSLSESALPVVGHPPSHPKYRPDIDGLRAIAVLSVVCFHAFPNLLIGGFIGVDIFFVISGFLISTILFENLDRGTFSFSDFYMRRIKRIFPALLIVLLATYLIGWFVLQGDEYRQLGKHLIAGAGFVSNFALWQESGYFDTASNTKPLLHLWSLGIEEQFYIVWPIILWAACKRKINLLTIATLICAASFYLNLIGISKNPTATFYSPQTRFWELLCGSILAWITLYKKNEYFHITLRIRSWLNLPANPYNSKNNGDTLTTITSALGLLLLILGFCTIHEKIGFPGNWAVVPVLSAVLIISAGPNALFNRTILSNRIIVWFGLISFPLYLWHWPLLTFARIVNSGEPSIGARIAVVTLSIFLAWITYRIIERPMRLPSFSKEKAGALFTLMLAAGSIGYITYENDGFAYRFKDSEEFINNYENSYPTWNYFKKINLATEWRAECAFFNAKKYLEENIVDDKPVSEIDPSCYKRDNRFDKAVMIWGDSHAQALSPGIVKYIPKTWQVLQVATSGCAPNSEISSPSSTKQCDQSNYFAIKTIKEAKPDTVVIAQDKGIATHTMAEITRHLKSLGVKRVLFLGPAPRWTAFLPKIFARKLWIEKPDRSFVGIDTDILKINEQRMKEFNSNDIAIYVDVIGLFCNTGGCITYTDEDIYTSLTTWDYGHLTPSASRYLAKNLLIKMIMSE